jgi:glycosyltransferase involved in cell wall biosynthesis
MNDSPKVTLCIPTFNCQAFVEATYRSLEKQNYSSLQFKFFDNHSDDGTYEIIQKLQAENPALQLTGSSENIGGENNFNRCLQAAEGDYTALFHADDIYYEGIVERAVHEMEKNPTLVAVAFHADRIDETGHSLGERFIPPELRSGAAHILDRKTLLRLVFKYGNFITCPSVVARTPIYRDHIKNWNGQDFKSSADLDVWLRMTEKGPLLFVNEAHMAYRESTASFSYNLIRARTHRHDLFLVLDHYLSDPLIHDDQEIRSFYNFLYFKDISLRSYNILRNNDSIELPAYGPVFKDVMRNLFRSAFHMKFALLGLGIFFMRLFSFKKSSHGRES